jgi:hypothetical protein
MRVHTMHVSLQYNDSPAQQQADADAVFKRASARDVWWLTGTEANTAANAKIQRAAATRWAYRYYRGEGDVWIAVDGNRAQGGIDTEWTPVVKGKAGRYPNRGVLRVSFDNEQLGRFSVLAAHYNLARGSGPKDNPKIAAAVGEQAAEHGRGARLVFYGGDQNIGDRKEDTFLGGPLTSAWDELGGYEATHDRRTIDVIASYNNDGRVSAVYCRALDDSELRLHTDHFLVEAGFEVAPLKRRR